LPDISAAYSDGSRTFNSSSFGLSFPTAPGEEPFLDPNGEIIGPVRTVDLRGRITATLFDLSAIRDWKSAQASANGAGALADAAAQQAGALAAANYVRALRGDARVAARTADSTLAAELLEIARAQLRAGVGIALDVTRAEAQVAAFHAQLIVARNDRDRAYLALRRALGLPLGSPLELTDSLSDVVPGDSAWSEPDLIAEASEQRPDLRAAAAEMEAARRSLSAARSERLPTIDVFADDGATSTSFTHLLNTYTYGVQFSLPIFDGLGRQARAEQREAALSAARVRADDLRDQIQADVHGSLLDLAAAREQVRASSDRLRLAEQEVDQARQRFRAGVASNADVVTALLSLNASRTQLIDARSSLFGARVAVAAARGAVTSLP
jgi:outer membrane protein TolC